MRWRGTMIAAALVVGIAGPSTAGQVQLSIRDGRVTLDARDATLREIFAEWARVGQTRVVNGENVTGGPVTLLMTDVPERRALETLLRSTAGFIAAPRPMPQPSLSTYDRIVVMPGSRPAAVPAAAQAGGPPSGPFQYTSPTGAATRGAMPQVVVADEPDDQPDATPPGPFIAGPMGSTGQRPGMIIGSPYSPGGGQTGGSPAQQQPQLPTASQRPGVPAAVPQPIK